jgi:exonuclease III
VEGTGFKLWYTGTATNKNGVGVLIDKSLKDGVVDVKRVGDRIILVKLVIGDLVLNVISAYAPQVGLNENSKREFWEGLEDMVSSVPVGEKLFIGGDLNGHVGTSSTSFEGVHGGCKPWSLASKTLVLKKNEELMLIMYPIKEAYFF